MIYVFVLLLSVAIGCGDSSALRTGDGSIGDVADGAASGAPLEASGAPAASSDSARAALEQGRFFRAAQLFREQMRQRGDTAPETIVLAARAAIGWGDWDGAIRLLDGRPWLDEHPVGWTVLGHAHFSREQWAPARDALRRAVAHAAHIDDREAALAQVRLAYAVGQLDEHHAAAREFERAAAALPALREWLDLFAAFAAARAGDVRTVDARLAGVDADLAREWGWRAAVDARTSAADTAAAIMAAERAAGEIEQASRRAEAWYTAASLRRARGDRDGARSTFRRAIEAAQGSSSARQAARALHEIGGLGADDQLLVGRTLIRHGDFERGTPLLRAWLQGGHGTATSLEALRLEIGEALFNGRQHRDAEQLLLDLARTSSNRARAASAHFIAGRAQYRDGRQTEGRATFERVAELYAGEAAAVRALYFAADLLHDEAEFTRARGLYRRAVDSGRGDVEEVGLAAMRLAGMAWVQGEYADAQREFDAYVERFPRGRVAQQALYWSARAQAERGNADAARRRMAEAHDYDPMSYYGALAADALGRSYPDITVNPAPQRRAVPAIERGIERVDLLRLIGWEQAASFEIDRLRRQHQTSDDALYTLAEELNARGLTTVGISIGRELQRRAGGWNDRLLRIVYPFPFRTLIESEAGRRGVDPFLAAGLIRQESMFHATAVSPAGAIGLMQVMPETGRLVASQAGVDRFTADMLRRPEVNVFIGMAYLADQLRSYDRRIDAVLGAYNAGPQRIARWRDFPEWRHGELFAERIPFAETRGYVKIVQANARIYRSLYGD